MVQVANGGMYGPPIARTAVTAVDLPAQAANVVTENEILAAGSLAFGPVVGQLQSGFPAASTLLSYLRRGPTGSVIAGIANWTGAPIDPGATPITAQALSQGLVREAIPQNGVALIQTDRVSVDLPSIAANGNAVLNVPLLGARTGDVVIVSPTALFNAGLVLSQPTCRVFTDDQVRISVSNITVGALDAGAVDVDLCAMRAAGRVGAAGRLLGQITGVTFPASAAIADRSSAEVAAPIAVAHPSIIAGAGACAMFLPDGPPPVGFCWGPARISANNTVSIQVANISGAGPTVAASFSGSVLLMQPPTRLQ